MSRIASQIKPYWELTKPDISLLVLISTFLGYFLGIKFLGESVFSNIEVLTHLMFGSLFSSAGVAILNEYIEREQDAKMHRTQSRPLPSGRITPKAALIFGLIASGIGVLELGIMVNIHSGILSFITISVYLFVYTPIKQKTKWNILIGAIPGALPPVGGWIAANGTITSQTFAIFCFLFFWQIPHFFSIAWLYKVDYEKAGFKMFMTDKGDIFRSNILLIGFSILTLVFSLLLIPSPTISMTLIITTATIAMGLLYVFTALKMALKRSPINARRLLFVSIIYIPVMLIIVIAGI